MGIVVFLLASIPFDMIQVFGLIFAFFCYLGGVDSSSWMIFSIIFLMAFVFCGGLGLSLSLRLTCISRKGIVRLSLVFIPMITLVPTKFVFFGEFIAFWVPDINFYYS